MKDGTTKERIVVHDYGTGNPYFMVPVDKLSKVKHRLDEKHIVYSVERDAISLDGQPAVVVISLSVKSNISEVQALLDSIP